LISKGGKRALTRVATANEKDAGSKKTGHVGRADQGGKISDLEKLGDLEAQLKEERAAQNKTGRVAGPLHREEGVKGAYRKGKRSPPEFRTGRSGEAERSCRGWKQTGGKKKSTIVGTQWGETWQNCLQLHGGQTT